MLGKTLSYELRRYDTAADVFARAVALDEQDDYAHHYLAYNLDNLGHEPQRVERHYRRAIELNDRHPWWRARFVRFLLTRGRTSAARGEWDRALDELAAADRTDSVAFYETLHGWVADTALRRGQLDFADSVLRDVPAAVRRDSPRIAALIHRLRALQLAEAEGAYVPAPYLSDGWWKQGPFRLSRRIGEGDQAVNLRRWLAGRIAQIGMDEIEVRVQEIDLSSDHEPAAATVRMSRADFDRLTRDERVAELTPGRFVEMGLYSDEAGDRVQRLIRVHPEREWEDATLPAQSAAERYLIAGSPA